MQTFLAYLANGLTVVGTVFLIVALFPIQRLIRQLPENRTRRRWRMLSAMIVLFAIAYAGYAALQWNLHRGVLDLLVPAVFCLGGLFVLLVGLLDLETASDIRHVAILEYETITDSLMGIRNRRYFDRRLSQETARARRYGLPLSVLLLDIDRFKNVNDTYGHQTGDIVLKNLGRLLRNAVRETDIAARYGGEEIAVIATQTRLADAGIQAERLRQAIEKTAMLPAKPEQDRPEVRITVSIGVASRSEDDTGARALIEKADAALYRAKRQGRNRVVLSEDSAPGPAQHAAPLPAGVPEARRGAMLRSPSGGAE